MTTTQLDLFAPAADNLYSKEQIVTATLIRGKTMVRHNLEWSDMWLVRGLLAIMAGQTAEEQRSEQTIDDNGIGFSGVDSAILSSFAKQVQKGMAAKKPLGLLLSQKQWPVARKLMLKYSGQLCRIARAKAQTKTTA